MEKTFCFPRSTDASGGEHSGCESQSKIKLDLQWSHMPVPSEIPHEASSGNLLSLTQPKRSLCGRHRFLKVSQDETVGPDQKRDPRWASCSLGLQAHSVSCCFSQCAIILLSLQTSFIYFSGKCHLLCSSRPPSQFLKERVFSCLGPSLDEIEIS